MKINRRWFYVHAVTPPPRGRRAANTQQEKRLQGREIARRARRITGVSDDEWNGMGLDERAATLRLAKHIAGVERDVDLPGGSGDLGDPHGV